MACPVWLFNKTVAFRNGSGLGIRVQSRADAQWNRSTNHSKGIQVASGSDVGKLHVACRRVVESSAA
jgi:hypothetical protein